jgi:protein-S-isoprenylcysteine O-methyltransferase Ste14
MLQRLLLLPVVLAAFCVTAGAVLQALVPVSLGRYSFDAGLIAGSVLLLLAAGFGGWAILEMKRHRTTVEPGQEPAHLVTSGPFAVSRNPIYVCFLLFVIALAVMLGSAWMAASALVLLVLLDRLVIRREEEVIARKFAAEYAAYRARVRRWL